MHLLLKRAFPLAVAACALAPAGASATITRSAITTPAAPTYRLHEINLKAEAGVRVVGTTDGQPGDLVDLICTRGDSNERVARDVPVDKAGQFEKTVALDAFKPAACILRAVPYKYNGKELDTFTGPPVSITRFDPRSSAVGVIEGEGTAVLDYAVESGHRRGQALLGSAARGGLQAHFGVHGTLDRYTRQTWSGGAGVASLTVDERRAYVGSMVPLANVEGRPYAPAGFTGVATKVGVDEATGAVIALERATAYTCDAQCLRVIDTGVRLERTTTFTADHSLVDVQDRWVSTDEGAHDVQLEYVHGSVADRWRFPGTPGFRAPNPVEPGASRLYVHDGTPAQAMGALTLDPPPAGFRFDAPGQAVEAISLTTPGTLRRSFEVGENLIQDPPPTPEPGPGPGAPEEPGDPQPEHPGTKRCVIPRVKAGTTLAAAKSALKSANCKTGTIRKVRSAKVRKGRVTGLARTAGQRLPVGTKVGIKVSRGRR